jgi:predicted lipoprotein with Yx(FWY)xxD motif
MRRLPFRVGGLTAAVALALVAAGCGMAVPSKSGADSIKVVSSSAGMHLVDAQGRSLYLFERDEKGDSYCYGACAAVWPPVEVDKTPAAVAGVPASALGMFKRDDGEMQAMYRGHPLYYYSADASTPGKMRGEDAEQFGSSWYLVGQNGKSVEPKDDSGGSNNPNNSNNSNNNGGGY